MTNKISVIVPIYNVEEYLERCIDSILIQDYDNFEVVLVDDCSTDKSSTIAKNYSELYPRKCIFVQRESNGKLSAARNTGIKVSTGDWVTFIDSDDWVEKNYLSSMINVAIKDESDIVACGYYHAWGNNRLVVVNPFGDLSSESSQEMKVALMRNHACMKLFRKSFIIENGIAFPEHIVRAEDMGFTIPLMTRTKRISIIKEPLYYYFQRQNSISNSNTNIDISFYYQAFKELADKSNCGFEIEIEYRAINEFLYGLVTVMIKSNRTNKEIKNHIDYFLMKYTKWKNNKYLEYTPKLKKTFIILASYKLVFVLKAIIFAFSMVRK